MQFCFKGNASFIKLMSMDSLKKKKDWEGVLGFYVKCII